MDPVGYPFSLFLKQSHNQVVSCFTPWPARSKPCFGKLVTHLQAQQNFQAFQGSGQRLGGWWGKMKVPHVWIKLHRSESRWRNPQKVH